MVTQAGDLLPEIKRRIALGWAAFRKVANITKSRKASMNVKRKVNNEYVLPVMVYGSETWALKKAHMELLSVAQRKMERIMLGRVTEWSPREWTRRQGRPKTRWRDNLIRHMGPAWPRIAKSRHLWREGFLLTE